jgi:hypothetical protein
MVTVIDTTNEERALVEGSFNEPATLIEQKHFSKGRLSIWRNSLSLPTQTFCSFAYRDGRIFLPNNNEESYQEVIKAIWADLSDGREVARLLCLLSPQRRKVIDADRPYMKWISATWHEPHYINGRFEAFFENLVLGIIEHISINEESWVTESVGEGMKLDFK